MPHAGGAEKWKERECRGSVVAAGGQWTRQLALGSADPQQVCGLPFPRVGLWPDGHHEPCGLTQRLWCVDGSESESCWRVPQPARSNEVPQCPGGSAAPQEPEVHALGQ